MRNQGVSRRQATTALIAARRERRPRPMRERESAAASALGASYVVVAIALAVFVPWGRPLDALLVTALVLAMAVLARIRFDVGSGWVCPIHLAFIPLLFIAPLPLVCLVLPIALALDELPDMLAGHAHPHRWRNWFGDSWFAVGPVIVLALAGADRPDAAAWPIYVAALGAQVVVGIGTGLVRERLAGQVDWRDELRSVVTAYGFEILLTPAGAVAVAVFFAWGAGAGLALVGVTGLILWRLAAWQEARRSRALERHREQWTRWLEDSALCERARHGHVGPDWQSTASVALALGRELALPTGLAPQLASVAHHVAADEERARRLVRAQTALGVASVRGDRHPPNDDVRADRELVAAVSTRWDEEGHAIPVLARVVAVARAYSALTAATDQRAAHSREIALEALSRAAGRELDPQIVHALRDHTSLARTP